MNISSDIKTKDYYKKMKAFCAYRERCSYEAEEKLRSLKASQYQINTIVKNLKKEGYIDDRRFAETYTRGKIFNNRWGKVKIKLGLKQLNIPEIYINYAIKSMNINEYKNILQKIIEKKSLKKPDTENEIRKNKIARYCIQKGFEPALVWEIIENKT